MKRIVFFSTLLILALTACSGSRTPQLIASYPSDQPGEPRLISSPGEVVFNAFLEMVVTDVERAAERAEELVYSYGGYLVSSQVWYQDGQKNTSVVLAIPVPNYDSLRSAVVDLGTLKSETVAGQLVSYAPGGQANYSHITVQFRPRPSGWPSISLNGWSPGHTIESAFHVFVSMFGFLMDIVLWATIVIGPFALMGWGAWAITRRIRR